MNLQLLGSWFLCCSRVNCSYFYNTPHSIWEFLVTVFLSYRNQIFMVVGTPLVHGCIILAQFWAQCFWWEIFVRWILAWYILKILMYIDIRFTWKFLRTHALCVREYELWKFRNGKALEYFRVSFPDNVRGFLHMAMTSGFSKQPS